MADPIHDAAQAPDAAALAAKMREQARLMDDTPATGAASAVMGDVAEWLRDAAFSVQALAARAQPTNDDVPTDVEKFSTNPNKEGDGCDQHLTRGRTGPVDGPVLQGAEGPGLQRGGRTDVDGAGLRDRSPAEAPGLLSERVGALAIDKGADTTDEVLWEGETAPFRENYYTLPDVSTLRQIYGLNCPPGTRVRVVRATDQPSELILGTVAKADRGRIVVYIEPEDAIGAGDKVQIRLTGHVLDRAADQPSEDQRRRLVQISKDHGATWWDLPDHAHWRLFAADPGLPVGQTYEAPNGDLYRWRWADQPTEVADDA